MQINFGDGTDFDTFSSAYQWLSGYGVRIEPHAGSAFDAYVVEVGPDARWSFRLRQADDVGDAWGPAFEVGLDDIAALTIY